MRNDEWKGFQSYRIVIGYNPCKIVFIIILKLVGLDVFFNIIGFFTHQIKQITFITCELCDISLLVQEKIFVNKYLPRKLTEIIR